jgi:hypothetical protein
VPECQRISKLIYIEILLYTTMGTKSLGKPLAPLAPVKIRSTRAGKAGGVFFTPNQVQRGIYLYQRVAGSVYVRYRETTKKVVGVSRLVGDEFLDASISDLITALESKNRK